MVQAGGGRRRRGVPLTAAGEELRPIVLALGHWGARWIGSRLSPGQLDAGFLMWDLRRFVRARRLPPDRTVVVQFLLPDARPREQQWWLVVRAGAADLCRDDPGHELTLVVESSVRALTEVWTGDRTPAQGAASRELTVTGPRRDATPCGRGSGRVCRPHQAGGTGGALTPDSSHVTLGAG